MSNLANNSMSTFLSILSLLISISCTQAYPEGVITCEDDDQCPSGWTCRKEDELCWKTSSSNGGEKGIANSGTSNNPQDNTKDRVKNGTDSGLDRNTDTGGGDGIGGTSGHGGTGVSGDDATDSIRSGDGGDSDDSISDVFPETGTYSFVENMLYDDCGGYLVDGTGTMTISSLDVGYRAVFRYEDAGTVTLQGIPIDDSILFEGSSDGTQQLDDGFDCAYTRHDKITLTTKGDSIEGDWSTTLVNCLEECRVESRILAEVK